ncbi:MAG TPA: phosphotransferase [Candidatus Saccharimonadales bacterium]|nr:phosphotransferase [Candidatus Saccharimonadales bacterium]
MKLEPSMIEDKWPLTRVSLGSSLKGVGGQRHVQVLSASEGRYICKTADISKSLDDLASDLLIFDFLRTKGFRYITRLLKTNNDQLFADISGSLTYLLEFVEGKEPAPTPKNYAQLGKITAELNSIDGYPNATKFIPATIIKQDLPKLTIGKSFHYEYLKLLETLPSFEDLPTALIHTDIALVNSIQKEDGSIVLIDWDDIGIGTRILDVAFPLIQQFVSEDCEYDETNAKAFYTAYRQTVRLTDRELNNIFSAALFIAMMYIIYGDSDKRWQRIRWALRNRELLENAFRNNTSQ